MARVGDGENKEDEAGCECDATEPVHFGLVVLVRRVVVWDGDWIVALSSVVIKHTTENEELTECARCHQESEDRTDPEIPPPADKFSTDTGDQYSNEEAEGCHGAVD